MQWVIDSIFALMNVLFAARITPVSVSGQSQLMSVSKRAPGRNCTSGD
ncbi:Mobile element protein (fragment) [Escherichia coli]